MIDARRTARALVAFALAAGMAAACTSEDEAKAGSTPTGTERALVRAPERVPASDPDAIPFEKSSLIIETNATDGDAGLQPFLDHEPWKWVAIYGPDGSKLVDVVNRGVLERYGLTELFSESSEPEFKVFPFEEFKKLFPEGEYTFLGETIDGKTLRSEVTLSHDVPAGPKIVSPKRSDNVTGEVVIRWEPGNQPAGIDIKAYQVIVETEEGTGPLRVLSAELPGDARELPIPRAFASKGKYKVEVLAREANGNQTLTEVPFSVG